jgi:hypothetical protein
MMGSQNSKEGFSMQKKMMMLVGMVLIFGCMSWGKVLTGVVSDAMCGAKHATASDDGAACVKKCEDGGSKLVVVSAGKVYNTDDQDKLKGFEGKEVKVTGKVAGDKVTIASVAEATKM